RAWSSGYHRLLIRPLRWDDRNSISVTLPGGLSPAEEAAGQALRVGGWVCEARPRAYRRDMRQAVVLVPVAAAALLTAACTGRSQPSAHPAQSAARASAAQAGKAQAGSARAGAAQAGAVTSNGCAGQPPVSPLPVWARSGFQPADQAMPHVVGEAGDIVAILWAPRDALHSPSLQDRSNKILWVSRIPPVAPDPPVIKAT